MIGIMFVLIGLGICFYTKEPIKKKPKKKPQYIVEVYNEDEKDT